MPKMNFITLLLASAAAFAAPTPEPNNAGPCRGHPSPDTYVVDGFSAHTTHLSQTSYFRLNITYNPTIYCSTSVTVECSGSISTLPPLVYLPSTPCSFPPLPSGVNDTTTGVSFAWIGSAPYVRDNVSYPGGFTLTLNDTYGAGYSGQKSFPGSAYEVYGHSPTYDDMLIAAPASFELGRTCA